MKASVFIQGIHGDFSLATFSENPVKHLQCHKKSWLNETRGESFTRKVPPQTLRLHYETTDSQMSIQSAEVKVWLRPSSELEAQIRLSVAACVLPIPVIKALWITKGSGDKLFRNLATDQMGNLDSSQLQN